MIKPTHFFNRPRLWGLLCGLTLAVAQLFTPAGGMGVAQAATLTVTSTADSGAGSLRQAIADAAAGDTITFALPNPSTITLSSELVIAKNLTISGPGAAALTISGNNATRVFFINPGAAGATSGPPATALTVQISGLTIANGKAQGGAGGARNRAGGSGGAAGMGGAIFSNHGNLTISGVIFQANQAQGGNSTGGGVSFFGAAGGGGVGGNGGAGNFAGGAGGSGGALGGNGGGGGADGTLLPNGSNGGNGAAGGEGAGGGGGGIGDDCPGFPSCTGPGANGGKGGNGGFGGGAGGGGSSGYDESGIASGGAGGAGGFGGGGGGGGSDQSFFGPAGAGGAGGAFGGNGGSSSVATGGIGGGGAGLGGAIFVRAGSLTLVDSSFSNNSTAGGSGAQNGQGKGGALFILSPATLNLACTTFSGNSAMNAAGSGDDTHDRYGSVASATGCDSTAPVITPNVVGTLGNNGWYVSDVSVSWTVVDNESTISSQSGCGTQNITSDTAGVTFTCSATSAGGSSSQSVTIKRDATAPAVIVTGVTSGATYTVGSVPTAACSTTDALSGVATQATLSVTGGNGDGTGSFTATCSGATDVAGNSAAPVSVSYSVNPPPDTTAPVITPNVAGTLGNNGWYVSDVSVSWTVVDNESTISSQSGCETQNITSDTAGDTFTCSATSAGGTASESVTVKRDATAPTISAAASSGPNANGWYNSNVTVQFTCNDNLSGVVSCPADETLSSEGGAVNSTVQTITDLAGNSSAASNVVSVQLDLTAPVVTVTGVSNGASYTLGSVPAAACSTSDALAGVATQATVSVTGGNGDGTGSFTATCSGATDLAGTSAAPVSVSYTVNAIVLTAYQQVQAVRTSLAALLPSGNSKNDKSLQKAISKIDQALASNLWQPDGNHLTLIGDDVFNRLQDAVKELAKLTNPPPAVATTRSSLVTSSRALAQLALAEAITGQGDAKKIAKAQSKLSKGDSEAAKGKLDAAIAQYEDCWEYAQQARGLPVASSLSAEEQPTDTDVDSDAEDAPASGAAQQIFLPQVSR